MHKSMVLVTLLSIPATAWPTEPVAVPIQRLSMDTALTAAQAGIAVCRKKGVQVSVVVIDRGGNAQVMLRDVLAPDVSADIAQRKAYTAMAFVTPTSSLTSSAATNLNHVPKLLFLPGGVPIQAGGTLFGAIGVAGAPTGTIDEQCAIAGQNAIQDMLELR